MTVFGMLAFGAQAAMAAAGFEGPSYKVACDPTRPACVQSAYGNPTGTKPESKLWVHDGLWWAVMWDTASGDYHIFWLDVDTDTWKDTGVLVDGRKTSRADALSDGNSLVIASHRFATAESTNSQAILRRYSYSQAARKYTLVGSETISNTRSETLVIDRDSTGLLWASWTQAVGAGQRAVIVARRAGPGDWRTTTLDIVGADEISSVVAFGSHVGVMWNNGSFRFATHAAGAAGAWTVTTAWNPASDGLPGGADDHINLKAGADGRVYAVVKTGQSSASHIRLLVREPGASGAWNDYAVSDLQGLTRPIVLLDGADIRVFANGPSQQSGTIYEKSANSPGGLSGAPLTAFIEKGSGPTGMVDATSTKQRLGPSTGLVVLASEEDSSRYWHNNDGEPTAPPPIDPPPDRGPNVIRGTRGPDVIRGTARRDIILGGGGNDRILGRGGNDKLVGGRGNDKIVGGRGRDRMLGKSGRDTLIAKDRRRDVGSGGSGFDRARRDGRDRLRSIERII